MSGCNFGRLPCKDGRCYYPTQGYKCPEEECSRTGDRVCENQIQCYWSEYQICDGENQCDDWTDEYDCPSVQSSSSSETSVLAIVIPIMVVSFVAALLLIGGYFFWRRKQRNIANLSYRSTSSSHLNLQPHPGLQTQSLNIQLPGPQYHAADNTSHIPMASQFPEQNQARYVPPQQIASAPPPPTYEEALHYEQTR